MNRKFSKLGLKIFTTISLISFVTILLFMGTFFYTFHSIMNEKKAEALMTATEAAEYIDGDEHSNAVALGEMTSPEYLELKNKMIQYKTDKNITYFYTVYLENSKTYYGVDAAITDAEALGSEAFIDEELLKALQGTPSAINLPDEDDLLSAYAPIKNSAGEIVGVAGVDIDFSSLMYIREKVLTGSIILSFVVMLLSMIASVLFSKSITSGVKRIRHFLNKMSEGDLTGELVVKNKDEFKYIANDVNKLRNKTTIMLREVDTTSKSVSDYSHTLSALSEEMAASSEGVAETVNNMSDGINSQSEEIIRALKTLNEFGIKIDDTQESMENVNGQVNNISLKAGESSENLVRLEDSIQEVNTSFGAVKERIRSLETNLSRISEITSLINSIADQTNLLALNAAIEAARAGEAGKGFGVVADEIRKLAEQSKDSSLSINDILSNISVDSRHVVDTSENMNAKLGEQIGAVKKSILSFREILDSIQDILPKVEKVNTDMTVIDGQKDQIIERMDAISKVGEHLSSSSIEISASMEEMSASSQDVAHTAQNLNHLTEDLVKAIEHFVIE